MAYIITIKDGNGKKISAKVNYETYRLQKNYRRKEIRDTEEAKNNQSYEEFCEFNEEYYMKISEQLTTASCESEVINRPFGEKLHKDIDQLFEKQRRRLILYYFNGLTFEEIGIAEGTSKIAIKHNVSSAIKNLKKILLKLNA